MRLFVLALLGLVTALGPARAEDYRPDPSAVRTFTGVLLFDGEEYALKPPAPIVCDDGEFKQRMETIPIGAGAAGARVYGFLRPYANKTVTLSGNLDNPRGGCALIGAKLQKPR